MGSFGLKQKEIMAVMTQEKHAGDLQIQMNSVRKAPVALFLSIRKMVKESYNEYPHLLWVKRNLCNAFP